jgi:hypothetical protein
MVENLFVSAIKQFGFDIYYIPRNINNLDKVFGEDGISSFEGAAKVEVYVKEAPAPGSAFVSQFGFNMGDSITLQLSRRRFNEIKTPKLMAENGYSIYLETADENISGDFAALELDSDNNFEIITDDPTIGDLIYFPTDKKLYEIAFVETRSIFYQVGNLQIWELQCNLFEYSHEDIDTGVQEIDIFNKFDGNSLDATLELENALNLIKEDGGSVANEEYYIENSDKQASNEVFTEEIDDIVDWSEMNPLIRPNSQKKW